MPNISILCGIVLVLIGVAGYGYALGTAEHASMTALIPAAFGIVMIILGAAAKASEALRKHLMHVAVLIALVGFIMTGGRMLMKISELTFGPAVLSQLLTAVVCLLFVILAIRSFIAARRTAP